MRAPTATAQHVCAALIALAGANALAAPGDAPDAADRVGAVSAAAAVAPPPFTALATNSVTLRLAVQRPSPGAPLPTQTMLSTSAWAVARSSVLLVEPAGTAAPGQPMRRSPRLALGVRSDGLRAALHHIGIDAQHCMAPMIRLRGRLADNGNLSAAFWVSARCSFR